MQPLRGAANPATFEELIAILKPRPRRNGPPREARDGESAQGGLGAGNRDVADAWVVASAHRPDAGDRPGHGRPLRAAGQSAGRCERVAGKCSRGASRVGGERSG